MTFIFRCDATQKTGLGHLSRCIALAEAFEECAVKSIFVGNFSESGLKLLVGTPFGHFNIGVESNSIDDIEKTSRILRDEGVKGIVADSYLLDNHYLDSLQDGTLTLAVVDDFRKLLHYNYDIVINFTINAHELKYPHSTGLQCLGTHYFLARRCVRSLKLNDNKPMRNGLNILIAMGGVDRKNSTTTIVQNLPFISSGHRYRVVIGGDFNYRDELIRVAEAGENQIEIVDQISDLSSMFSWCDACICAGGLTKYEAAYLGIPLAVLSQTGLEFNESQTFFNKGMAYNLGFIDEVDHEGLEKKVAVFLEQSDMRNMLSAACNDAFPLDPTAKLAETIVEYSIKMKGIKS